MRYENHRIDQVQAACDITDVISQYIPLKRAGRNFKAVCPFHQEKTPSFMVHPEKQIFHCFGCGAGGNVFNFVMRYENLSFPEALRLLAERAHIELPEASREKRPGGEDTERLYELYRSAADYYHALFMHPEKGKAAREYLKQRGFDVALAGEFKIGWALAEWRGLLEHLGRQGFPETLLLKSGLIQRSAQGKFYDVFRGRILFPIHNLRGKAVAFGGRLLGEGDGPKYLNSPENPIFSKRKELFGLHLAKRHIDRDLPRILVVEGYLDFLRLYSMGFKASVATLGTALSEEHVQILKRFADEAVVIYDGDKAGEMASLRGLEVFLEGGMNVKLIRMAPGYDPDDYLKEKGAAAFDGLLASAKDFFEYKLEIAGERYDRGDSLGLMRMTQEFLETFSKIKHPVLLNHYLRKLSSALNMDEGSLRVELAKMQKKSLERQERLSALSKDAPAASFAARRASGSRDEILILSLLMDEPEFREKALSEIEDSDFEHPEAKGLFQAIRERRAQGEPLTLAGILNSIEKEEWKNSFVSLSALQWTKAMKEKAFGDCLRRIRQKRVERRLARLRRFIEKAEKEGKDQELSAYTKEYQVLLQQIKR